ncbi:MAG: phage protease [Planctomycetota bacterium]
MTAERIRDWPLEAIECRDVSPGDGLRTVRLLPWGTVKSKKGTFFVDREGAESVIAEFERHAVEVPIDVEHASLNAELPAKERGAVGWIVRVFAEANKGLFALIRWTPRGRELIRNEEFAYLSPVVLLGKTDRRIVELHSAAVVTKPAIAGMEKLAASASNVTLNSGETNVDFSKLREVLSLNADAEDQDVIDAALGKIQGAKSNDVVANAVRSRIGLDASADAATVLVALDSKLVETGTKANELRVDELMRTALSSGKIGCKDEARKTFVRDLAMRDFETAEQFVSMLQGPPQGQTRAPSQSAAVRDGVIREAMSAFRGDESIGRVTSMRAYVDDSLRSKALGKLDENDVKVFGIAV